MLKAAILSLTLVHNVQAETPPACDPRVRNGLIQDYVEELRKENDEYRDSVVYWRDNPELLKTFRDLHVTTVRNMVEVHHQVMKTLQEECAKARR